MSLVSSVLGDHPKDRLKESLGKWTHRNSHLGSPITSMHVRSDDSKPLVRGAILAINGCESEVSKDSPGLTSPTEVTCFATHGSFGVVDLGATKTVIGSDLVTDLIKNLSPEVQKTLSRCTCSITFRFGNHGVLESKQALVIPIQGFLLKVAIVPGSTPFLLSNTLLRALGAVIDTERKELHAKNLDRTISLHLTTGGLFLLDINDLAEPCHQGSLVEKHAVSDAKQDGTTAKNQQSEESNNPKIKDNECKRGDKNKQGEIGTSHEDQHEPCVSKQPPSSPPISSVCPKPIAKGFTVPECRKCHGRPRSPPSEVTNPSGARDAGHESVQHPSDGCLPDRLRKGSPGTNLFRNLEHRSEVGEMVYRTLPTLTGHQAQDVPPLCRVEDRTCRTRRNSNPTHAEDRGTTTKGNYQGEWETLPKTQGQVNGHGISHHRTDARDGVGLRSRRFHVGAAGAGSGVSGCATSGSSNAAHGECPHPGHRPFGEDHHQHGAQAPDRREVRDGPEWETLMSAGDICGQEDLKVIDEDLNVIVDCERNRERKYFQHMVKKIQHELTTATREHVSKNTPRCHLFEVFCGPQSQLTHQAQQLGFRSERFGFAQCDLQTSSGRKLLFHELLDKRPDNIWFSPSCKPWGKWSNLNGAKSLEAWDQLHDERIRHIEQIALGIVLLRYQRSVAAHFHWEQPQGSLMFRLPYLAESFHYLLAVDFEMCTAGNLKDPQNKMFLRKAMTVMTTSPKLVQKLQGYRCKGEHEHQTLEGQTIYQGTRMNRTTYSENYPRKFARIVASTVCKIQRPKEQPYRVDEQVLANEASITHDRAEPSGKRRRVSQQARLKMSRTLEATQVPWGK